MGEHQLVICLGAKLFVPLSIRVEGSCSIPTSVWTPFWGPVLLSLNAFDRIYFNGCSLTCVAREGSNRMISMHSIGFTPPTISGDPSRERLPKGRSGERP